MYKRNARQAFEDRNKIINIQQTDQFQNIDNGGHFEEFEVLKVYHVAEFNTKL